jgi:putative addiction module CopG family antidote
MVINVPADLAERIRQKVASGGYHDESEVIRVALRLLDARDRAVRELRESVAEGLAALERGEGREWTPELMDELDRRADEQLRLDLPPKPDVCP